MHACAVSFAIIINNFAETIYDEPSLPDPIHQELNVGIANCIEMTDNRSYMAANLAVFNLNECPAYVNRDNSGV